MRFPCTLISASCLAAGVFLTGAARSHAQTDGSQRWAFTTLSSSTAGTIVSSPAQATDGTLYIGVEVGSSTSATPSGILFALNPNGSEKWRFTAPEWIDATPAIGADGTVYVGCWNGMLYALNPANGAKRWEVKLGSFIASSPAIGPDGTIYVGAGANLAAVAPNGTQLWSFPTGDWIDSSPAVGPEGTIYVGSWDNKVYAVTSGGVEKWSFATGDNVSSSPALAADGTVYVGSRDLKVYALTAGGTLRWAFETNDTIETAPALGADGTIYITSTAGRLFALDRNGNERWRYPAAAQPALNPIYSSPAVRADGSILFGSSDNALFAVRSDGTLLWRTPLGDWSDSSPLVTNDGIYLGASDKRVYAFHSTAGGLATDWPQFRRDAQRRGWAPLGAVAGTAGRLSNLSVRTFAGSGNDTLIVGFYVGGAGSRSLLVRGIGPTLATFGVSGFLANPRISAFDGPTVLAANDDWSQAANAASVASTAGSVGAFALPNGSLDAALMQTFSPGSYTVQVAGAAGATGIALLEAYDGGGGSGRLANVSARSLVTPGSGVLIAGFVVDQGTRAVLVRGIGPALSGFGVGGALTNPQLRVFQSAQVIAENDDWSVSADAAALASRAQSVGAFALQPGSADAALLLTLPPGAYTAQVSGANNSSGVALIEVYELQ